MENGAYSFTKRVLIEGIAYPVSFIFRMLNGVRGSQYKVRTANPVSDFNMHITQAGSDIVYKFEDEATIPLWLRTDKNAQHKLSEAILSVGNQEKVQ